MDDTLANSFIEAFYKVKDNSCWKDKSDTALFREMNKQYGEKPNKESLGKKWVCRNDWKKPQLKECKQLEEILGCPPRFFAKILGYTVYDHVDCEIIKNFYVENIRSQNKILVYVLLGATAKGNTPEGLTAEELVESYPEIKSLKLKEVKKNLDLLVTEGSIKKTDCGKYTISFE